MLLGGSPLRLFRISERARGLVARWRAGAAGRRRQAGAAPGPPPGVGRGVRAAAGTDAPSARTTSRSSCRCATGRHSSSGCSARSAAWRASWSTTRPPTPAPPRRSPSATGPGSSGWRSTSGPSAARNAGLAAVDSALVAFVDSDCVPGGGLARIRCSATSTTRWWPRWRRASCPPRAGRAPARSRYEALRSSLDRGAAAGPGAAGQPDPLRPERGAARPRRRGGRPRALRPGAARRRGRRPGVAPRGGRAGTSATCRRAPSRTTGRRPSGAFLARQAFYGSTAGPLALRHGEALAPVHTSAWSLAVWVLTLARRPVLAQATLAASVAILANRLARPRARPGGGGRPHRRGRHGALGPAGARRAWRGPGRPRWCSGWPSAGPGGRRPSPCSSPRCGDWADDPGALDPVRYAALHVADDVGLRGGRLGRLRAGAHGRAPRAAHLVALPGVVVAGPLRRSLGRADATAETTPRTGRGYPLAKRSCPPWSSQSVDSQKATARASSPTTIACMRRTPSSARRCLRRAQEPAARARRGGAPGPPPGGRWSRASRPTRRSRTRRSRPSASATIEGARVVAQEAGEGLGRVGGGRRGRLVATGPAPPGCRPPVGRVGASAGHRAHVTEPGRSGRVSARGGAPCTPRPGTRRRPSRRPRRRACSREDPPGRLEEPLAGVVLHQDDPAERAESPISSSAFSATSQVITVCSGWSNGTPGGISSAWIDVAYRVVRPPRDSSASALSLHVDAPTPCHRRRAAPAPAR